MVVNPSHIVNNYHSIVDYSIIFHSTTGFHLSAGVSMKNYFKSLKETSFKVANFVVLLPIYFIGIGISKVLWYFSTLISKESKKGWIESERLIRKLKDYEEMY